MADTKITGLAALAEAPNASDLLVLVDVSDTTMDAAGTNKKITFANLTSGLGGGSPVNVIETADFQLDPAGDHPDRCVIVLTGSNSSSIFPWIKLPALVDQPAAGYTVTAVLTIATNTLIGVTSNDTLFWVSGNNRLEISYVGDDFWLIDPGGGAPQHLLNADP